MKKYDRKQVEILRKSVTVTARYCMFFQGQKALRQPGIFAGSVGVLLSEQDLFFVRQIIVCKKGLLKTEWHIKQGWKTTM